MKTIPFLTILIFASCQKYDKSLNPDFERFIGVWENKIGDHEYRLEVSKNRKVVFKKSYERAAKFKATNFRRGADIVNSVTGWDSFILAGKDINPQLSFYINAANDSIYSPSLKYFVRLH